jgi:hypothetical protein
MIDHDGREIGALREALLDLLHNIGGHNHWDREGTRGANCQICQQQYAAKERAWAVLREFK